ncbi:hypothetical protein WB532_003736 [Vibrio vulnificus]
MKGIVCIVAYNRPKECVSLLKAISKSKGIGNVDRVILSIDYSDNQKEFFEYISSHMINWSFTLEFILRDYNFGLKSHVLACGDLVKQSDYIIILEEDVLVSNYFFDYVVNALNFLQFNDVQSIAGVSLYSYKRDEKYRLPFQSDLSKFDNLYMQFAPSWGQCYTRNMWLDFRNWLESHDCDDFLDSRLPDYVCGWPCSSWKKHYTRYLVDQGKFFFYPKVALSSNPGCTGQNHNLLGDTFNVPLLKFDKEWKFTSLKNSVEIYDVNFNLTINGGNQPVEVELSAYQLASIRYKAHPVGVKQAFLYFLYSIECKIFRSFR